MASASSSPRRSGDGDETLGRPLVATVRGRAFTQIEDASTHAALPDYVAVTPPTSAPSTPPRASGKTLEIKKLVSPARSPSRTPNGPAAPPVSIRTAATLVSAVKTMGNAPSTPSPTVATTPGSLGRDLFNSASPSAAAAQTTRASLPSAPTTNKPPPLSPARASDDLDMQRKARRVSQWREEAERLSMRVRELEKENQQLRRLPMPPRTLSGGEYLDSLAASGTASLSDRENGDSPSGGDREHIRTRMRKSQSVASGFGYTGRTVAEAAAASHRSRSKRLGASSSSFTAQPLQKYKSGYWNEQVGVKSSFSCNNLADMESRALAIERPQAPPQRPLTLLHKAHSTNTKSSAKANRDVAAMMRAPSTRKSDSFQRSSLEASGEEIATIHKHQLAIAKSFRGANVMRATPPMSHRKDRKELDIDELTDDGDDADADDTDEEDHVEVTSPRSYFEKSLRGVGGSFRLPNKSTTLAVAKRPTSSDVRMWVGTWNMGAADPFVDKNGIIDEQASASMLQQFVPHGYQLYVLGLQEGVSENAYHAVAAYLNRNETGTRYYRLELKNSDSLVANKNHPGEATIDAVRGRGDGAFVGTKFTGLAIFYAAPIQDKIKLLRAGVHKFNLTSGSKGGVAAALMINQTSIVFVNCHLDARNDGYRREQIRNLNANLGKVMGHPSFDLTEQFHHVVWMGDMNYRIVHLDPDIVLHMLEEGRNAELHDKFDGLLNDRRNGGVFDGFTEPNKFPDFYPTYKKFPKRGRVNYRSPSWSRLVYRVLYKEPFYKGGKVKKRVPGWCDRILIHSLLVGDSKLMPEKVVSPFEEQPTWIDNYRSVNEGDGMDVSDHSPVFATFTLSFPMQSDALNNVSPRHARRNSRSLSSVSLRESTSSQSRSQVGGSYFDNPNVVRRIAANVSSRPVSTVLRVFNMQLFWNDNVVVPKRTRVVAPLIGEDIKQCDVIGERCQGTNGLNLSLNAVVQHTRQLEHLHMLVWVKHETISGHCTLSLKRIARQDEGGEVKFRVPLYNNSMRLYYDGYPLVLVFSVRSKTFAK